MSIYVCIIYICVWLKGGGSLCLHQASIWACAVGPGGSRRGWAAAASPSAERRQTRLRSLAERASPFATRWREPWSTSPDTATAWPGWDGGTTCWWFGFQAERWWGLLDECWKGEHPCEKMKKMKKMMMMQRVGWRRCWGRPWSGWWGEWALPQSTLGTSLPALCGLDGKGGG